MEKKNIDWSNIGFGYMQTDKRYVSNYKDGAWDEGTLTSDATITISECAGVLQYAQTCFEGMKAYTTEDGHIVTFRPDLNAARMADSAARLEMPVFPEDRFVDAIKQVVAANAAYVPPYGSGATLYVRPYMFGSSPVIGVKPAEEYQFRVFAMIYADHEQDEAATIRKFRIVQNEGGRQVTRSVNHYNLQMIIAVGFKVNNQRAVRFRVWANQIVEQYTIKGWAMDEERLKNGGTVLTKKYFEEQLERIREIRISERNFYQKLTDIYATSLDYDRNALTTKEFFAKVQNKMHYAVHRHTAAELIYERADAEKPHMGLHTWKDAPNGKIKKSDVSVAKNYLTEDEMKSMELIVSAYLDLAENRARRHIPMTMEDWAKRLDIYLQADDLEVLKDAGKISAQLAKMHAETEFEKYRVVQDRLYQSDFDRYLEENLE